MTRASALIIYMDDHEKRLARHLIDKLHLDENDALSMGLVFDIIKTHTRLIKEHTHGNS